MKILVIEDSAKNVASAHTTLVGHDVTVIDNIKDAYDLLLKSDCRWDAVLTDMMMPVGNFTGYMDTTNYEKPDEIAAGLVFAIKTVNIGARVVICTDSNHHQNWYCTLLDLIDWSYNNKTGLKECKVAYVEARVCHTQESTEQEPVKNWKSAMLFSGLFPELETKQA